MPILLGNLSILITVQPDNLQTDLILKSVLLYQHINQCSSFSRYAVLIKSEFMTAAEHGAVPHYLHLPSIKWQDGHCSPSLHLHAF